MSEFGLNIGAAVAEIMEQKQIELPIKEGLRIVGIRFDDQEPGRLTLPACVRQTGVAIIGPGGKLSSAEKAMEGMLATRFVFHPVVMGERGKIAQRCSIVNARRIKLDCPRCKHSDILFHDQIGRDKLRRERDFAKHPEQDIKRPNFNTLLCPKCKAEGVGVEMLRVGLEQTLVEKGTFKDPVFAGKDDAGLESLISQVVYHSEYPEVTVPILPRVWAVYPIGRAPNDWMPTDAKALEIERRMRTKNATIRPFDVAMKAGGELQQLLLEAAPEMEIGWVKETDLATSAYGFRREFIDIDHPRTQSIRAEKPNYIV